MDGNYLRGDHAKMDGHRVSFGMPRIGSQSFALRGEIFRIPFSMCPTIAGEHFSFFARAARVIP